jgi:SAM-dependent methyltransferase
MTPAVEVTVPTWDEAANWYLAMVNDTERGFNDVAAGTCAEMLGDPRDRDVLDVGCGEGHVARRLAAAGARVRAVDPTRRLLQVAIDAEARRPLGIRYAVDRAETLDTVATDSADAVCAVLALHHVNDLAAAFRQIYRVLRPGGVLVSIQPHPCTDHRGATWTTTADGPRRTMGEYYSEGYWSSGAADSGDEVTSVRDIGWNHHTIATWLTLLAMAGFRLEEVREPLGAQSTRLTGSGQWSTVPRLFAFRARK